MKEWLAPEDFKACPIWRYDEDADGYFAVRDLDDLPELVRDLSILAEFTTPDGKRILGKIGGVERVFAIGLFAGGQIFIVNRNMPNDAREQAEEFLAASGLLGELSYESMFPLRYETKWGGPMFKDFSGVFEMPG